MFIGFPLASAVHLSLFASFCLITWNSGFQTAAVEMEKQETCPTSLLRWMLWSESRPRAAFHIQGKRENCMCWCVGSVWVGCKVSLTESYQGIQGAKYYPYTSLRLSCQGCRKMPISSYCSAHTYSLWMSLDSCARFKAEQRVVLF